MLECDRCGKKDDEAGARNILELWNRINGEKDIKYLCDECVESYREWLSSLSNSTTPRVQK